MTIAPVSFTVGYYYYYLALLFSSTAANGACSSWLLLVASKRFERYSVSFLVKWCILVALISTLE